MKKKRKLKYTLRGILECSNEKKWRKSRGLGCHVFKQCFTPRNETVFISAQQHNNLKIHNTVNMCAEAFAGAVNLAASEHIENLKSYTP